MTKQCGTDWGLSKATLCRLDPVSQSQTTSVSLGKTSSEIHTCRYYGRILFAYESWFNLRRPEDGIVCIAEGGGRYDDTCEGKRTIWWLLSNGMGGNIISPEISDDSYSSKSKCCEVSKPHSSQWQFRTLEQIVEWFWCKIMPLPTLPEQHNRWYRVIKSAYYVNSMRSRCLAVIRANGGHTWY